MNGSSYIKSIMPVQYGGHWVARVRFIQGTEQLVGKGAQYTLAQSQVLCDSLRRDIRRHGAAVLDCVGT